MGIIGDAYDEDLHVVFVRSEMHPDLIRIRETLCEMAEAEATKLCRLAWKMEKHNCDPKNIEKCREEARFLHMTGYPERLLDTRVKWEYAFKIR